MKMTQAEAVRWIESKGCMWEDRVEFVRYCSHCGFWVPVDDFDGNADVCDACLSVS